MRTRSVAVNRDIQEIARRPGSKDADRTRAEAGVD